MQIKNEQTKLCVVIPCYNEQEVLPKTAPMFLIQLNSMIKEGLISGDSRIMFVNDGSQDQTWNIICELANQDKHFRGCCLSRNRGHQNALLAGLMEAKEFADVTISIDCDGQDDISVMSDMVKKYYEGNEIVYGVRNDRTSDTFFKRKTAQGYYHFLEKLGAEVVYNHADYRLMSSRVLRAFADFEEVNLYLRGLVPLVGFRSDSVEYARNERIAGKSHYPLSKMLALAFNGITSLSVKPLSLITGFGVVVALISFIGAIWAFVRHILGVTVQGWASMTCIICFVSGVQLICMGILGQYIGKIYLETKHRPRYIISERTWDKVDE